MGLFWVPNGSKMGYFGVQNGSFWGPKQLQGHGNHPFAPGFTSPNDQYGPFGPFGHRGRKWVISRHPDCQMTGLVILALYDDQTPNGTFRGCDEFDAHFVTHPGFGHFGVLARIRSGGPRGPRSWVWPSPFGDLFRRPYLAP